MMNKSSIWALLAIVAAGCAGSEPPPTTADDSTSTERATLPTSGGVDPEPTPLQSSDAVDGGRDSGSGTSAVSSAKPATEASPAEARAPDVVYVPTPQSVVDKMLTMVKVKKSDVVFDLGCGDGRIVVTAAKRYGTRAFGYDIDPKRVEEARENVRKNKVEHLVQIEQKDIFTLDLSPADVVALYLLPELNVKLIPQLEKLKPGTRIVSHDFDMKGVTPLKHLTMSGPGLSRDHEIFVWHTPLRVQN
jgi:SAM-dependent methyltransferase